MVMWRCGHNERNENLLTSTQSIEINATAAGRLRCPCRLYGPTSTLRMNRMLLFVADARDVISFVGYL